MLIQQESSPVLTQGLLRTTKASIKASAKTFGFFSDNTYSNNPVAIVRELVANAVDAHTAAGTPELEVEVWLPTDLDPTFRARDRGIGMSDEFMNTNYGELGNGSTKDDSNNQIGGFGIGRFAAFSMVDQYTVRTVHNGIVGVYSIFKDEDGIPTVGLLGLRETNEPNGTEVSFPVKSEDFGMFANAANDALKYFNPLPIVHNGAIDAPDYVMRGKNWAMHRKTQALGVIMGGIRYPVSVYNLDYELKYDDKLSPLLEYGLDITVPIGACPIALSREALSYTPQTSASIRAALEAMITDITDSFSTMFDHYETEWEAKKALMAEVSSEHQYGARGTLLMKNALYRGEPLEPSVSVSGSWWEIEAKSRKRGGGYRECPNPKWSADHQQRVRLDNYEQVIIDDLPMTPKSATIKRIKAFIDTTAKRDKRTLVLRDPKFSIDIPEAEFLYTSSLPEPEKVIRTKYDRPRVRMFRIDDNYLSSNFNPGKYSRAGVREIPYSDQPDSGILVVGENFDLPHSTYNKLLTGLVKASECRFVNANDAKKLTKGWVRFEYEFDRRVKAAIESNPDLPVKLAVRNSPHCRKLFDRLKHLKVDDFPKSKQKTPVARIVQLQETYLSEFTNLDLALSPYIAQTAPSKINFEKLEASFHTQHPKAAHYLNCCGTIHRNTMDQTIFLELI